MVLFRNVSLWIPLGANSYPIAMSAMPLVVRGIAATPEWFFLNKRRNLILQYLQQIVFVILTTVPASTRHVYTQVHHWGLQRKRERA